jgi:hypothetical protein
MNADPYTLEANILAVFNSATDDERMEGISWYEAANTFAHGMHERYGISVEVAAGVIAAVSPQLLWDLNMRHADTLARTGSAPLLGLSKSKGLAILAGEPIPSVLMCATCKYENCPTKHACSGEKVRNFYACILNPTHPTAVCIDRHAYDVAMGYVGDEKSRKALDRVGVYEIIANAYRSVAARVGMSPATVQAITWVVWRNQKSEKGEK